MSYLEENGENYSLQENHFVTFDRSIEESTKRKKMKPDKKTVDATLLHLTIAIIKRKKVTDTKIAKKVGVSNPTVKDVLKQDRVKTETVKKFKTAYPDEYNLAILEKEMSMEDFFDRFSESKISIKKSLEIRTVVKKLFVTPEKWSIEGVTSDEFFKRELGGTLNGQSQVLMFVSGAQLKMQLTMSRLRKLYICHPLIAIRMRPILDDEYNAQQKELMGTGEALQLIIKKLDEKGESSVRKQLDFLKHYIEENSNIEKRRNKEYMKSVINHMRIRVLEGNEIDNDYLKGVLEEIETNL